MPLLLRILPFILGIGGEIAAPRILKALSNRLAKSAPSSGAGKRAAELASRSLGSPGADLASRIAGGGAGFLAGDLLLRPPDDPAASSANSDQLAALTSLRNLPNRTTSLGNQLAFRDQLQAEVEAGNLAPLLEELGISGGI